MSCGAGATSSCSPPLSKRSDHRDHHPARRREPSAIATRDIKSQIAFFTDVLGLPLKALYRMHGAEGAWHGFVELNPTSYIAFVCHPDNPGTRDWEVELVAVIGAGGRHIEAGQALDHVAGFCIGQDISERRSQMAGTPPQFSLAKSHEGFAPIGPWLTTLDELDDPGDLAIETVLDNDTVQSGRTKQMIFDVAALVAHLSGICELFPGDLIFTGTPAGVGYSRTPARFLTPGNTLTSTIQGLGELRNPCTAA